MTKYSIDAVRERCHLIEETIHEFIEHGFKPDYLVLGVDMYIALKCKLHYMRGLSPIDHTKITTYRGYEIVVVSSSGVVFCGLRGSNKPSMLVSLGD